jgi:hypothetical protein
MAADYGSLVPVLARAIQQLKSLFDSDNDALANLKAGNDAGAKRQQVHFHGAGPLNTAETFGDVIPGRRN